MGQFAVHRNNNPKTRNEYPFLLNLQSNLLGELRTRLVAPLAKRAGIEGDLPSRLTIYVEIGGESFAVLITRMASIEASSIGAYVSSLDRYRHEIISALDFLVTGI
jgi:toxin CcdB